MGLPIVVHGQELSPLMEEIKTLCLDTRNAWGGKDGQALAECRDRVENFNRKSASENLVCDLRLKAVDSKQKEIPDSFLLQIMSDEYLTYQLEHNPDLSPVPYDGHSQTRGTIGPVGITHKGILAKSTMQYEVRGCSNNMQLVVVVADMEDVNLSVTSKLFEGGDTAVEQKVTPADKFGVFAYSWKMPAQSSNVILTIENPNEVDVTCVIALQ